MADVETGSAKNAFALIDFVRDTDFDAAFGAEECAPAAGNTPVRDIVVLLLILIIHGYSSQDMKDFRYFITGSDRLQVCRG